MAFDRPFEMPQEMDHVLHGVRMAASSAEPDYTDICLAEIVRVDGCLQEHAPGAVGTGAGAK